MGALGVPFDVLPLDLDETPAPGETPGRMAERLAEAKALGAAAQRRGDIAIGSDTVVALGSRSLGKPDSTDEAVQMLRALRGREHRVITAVAAARSRAGAIRTWKRTSITRVWMRGYTDAEIEAYVATGDPMDKAGSYAIQHPAFHPVARIEGCYLTVVGLPLPELRELLALASAPLAPIAESALTAVCPNCTDRAVLCPPP